MSKKKEKTMTIATRDELETAMNDYAVKAAAHKGIAAELDVELGKVRERYAGRLTEIADAMEPVAEAIEEWAVLHPEAFGDKKSLELIAGRIGFRTTPPAVKTLRGVKEESAIRLIEEANLRVFLRGVTELNRETILAGYATNDSGVTDVLLKSLGLRIVQTETFYIDPLETKAEANP